MPARFGAVDPVRSKKRRGLPPGKHGSSLSGVLLQARREAVEAASGRSCICSRIEPSSVAAESATARNTAFVRAVSFTREVTLTAVSMLSSVNWSLIPK